MSKGTTKQRGYAGTHIRIRRGLLAGLVDGTSCYWCGLPMFREPTKNWDARPLAADHDTEKARDRGRAGRLLHFTCNSQRQDGRFDNERPAVLGCAVQEWNERRREVADQAEAVPFVW